MSTLLVLPLVPPSKLMQSVKAFPRKRQTSYSAERASILAKRILRYWIRDEPEYQRVRRYIEHNPVRAGLVAKPEEYRLSSAHAGFESRRCRLMMA